MLSVREVELQLVAYEDPVVLVNQPIAALDLTPGVAHAPHREWGPTCGKSLRTSSRLRSAAGPQVKWSMLSILLIAATRSHGCRRE